MTYDFRVWDSALIRGKYHQSVRAMPTSVHLPVVVTTQMRIYIAPTTQLTSKRHNRTDYSDVCASVYSAA